MGRSGYLKYRHAAELWDETPLFATGKIIITFVYFLCDSECDISKFFFGQKQKQMSPKHKPCWWMKELKCDAMWQGRVEAVLLSLLCNYSTLNTLALRALITLALRSLRGRYLQHFNTISAWLQTVIAQKVLASAQRFNQHDLLHRNWSKILTEHLAVRQKQNKHFCRLALSINSLVWTKSQLHSSSWI